MNPSFQFDADGVRNLGVSWEDGEYVFCRGWRADGDGGRNAVLAVSPVAERPLAAALDRLAHEYDLRDELDSAWAARPLGIDPRRRSNGAAARGSGRRAARRGCIGAPMEAGRFLRLAIGIAAALGEAHQRGLVHKDIKPANILVNCADGADAAHRVRHRLASAARASGARAARGHRRHARLYGARTDRAHEPLDRFAQRPLCARRHVLSDAHRPSAVQRRRSDGMGPLPCRPKACGAGGAAGERPGRYLRDRHEASRQDGRGALPDRRRP